MGQKDYLKDYKGNAYVKILEDREMFTEFVVNFALCGDITEKLDFESAEKLQRAFISEKFKKGERDIAWKVPFKNREESLYIVFLI